ncbi:Fibrinogen C domain-containing protein 1 [Chionoecetes opilio]|uniref:Fibrinogen C domain-containing protein 1 n=1 Tax=Chionoecetes opilio TaxID=41210 RepID=A0A8J4Y3X4_CHIOP|nr:Fibrinogen C domain-containing protein 1 [Chionoecetes opilio]
MVVVVRVTAAVGPRQPEDGPSDGSVGGGGDTALAACGAALLKELYTITNLVLDIKTQRAASPPPPPVVHDCSTLRQAGVKGSGVYQVSPFPFKVFCDMERHGGGWTVIQRRLPQKVQVNFSRGWSAYQEGFGQLGGEMWLGLEALHQLTHAAHYELRVDMVDYELGHRHAHYQVFRVGAEKEGYRLTVANYSGDAGDALSHYHSGRRFSTFDRDQDMAQDKNCALDKEGGWWFHACYSAHPNGHFPATLRRTDSKNIRWWKSREQVLVLTHMEMKIRRRATDASVVTNEHEAGWDDRRDDDRVTTDDDRVTTDEDPVTTDEDRVTTDEEDQDYKIEDHSANENRTGDESRSDTPPWGQQAVTLENVLPVAPTNVYGYSNESMVNPLIGWNLVGSAAAQLLDNFQSLTLPKR